LISRESVWVGVLGLVPRSYHPMAAPWRASNRSSEELKGLLNGPKWRWFMVDYKGLSIKEND